MKTVFELEISAGGVPGAWSVRVVRSAGGTASRNFELDVDDLVSQLPNMETAVLASVVPARRVLHGPETAIQRVGVELFDAVFRDDVLSAYRASKAIAVERREALQIRLRLDEPALAALPWETLFDRTEAAYVCRRDPLVRQIDAPDALPALDIEPPLRILGMVSAPTNLPRLNVEMEREQLETALERHIAAGRVQLEWLEETTWASLHERLLAEPWHVLHFVGHGDYAAVADEGVLAFTRRDGRAELVGASALADLLAEADPIPRLVVLNSCQSASGGTNDLLSSTAAALVRSGIPAAAAMQFTISDDAAIAFTEGFYAALGYGRTVDEAVRSGRIRILGLSGTTLEWVTPVLYVRGADTRLFTMVPPSGARPATPAVGPVGERPPQDGPPVAERPNAQDPALIEPETAPPEVAADVGSEAEPQWGAEPSRDGDPALDAEPLRDIEPPPVSDLSQVAGPPQAGERLLGGERAHTSDPPYESELPAPGRPAHDAEPLPALDPHGSERAQHGGQPPDGVPPASSYSDEPWHGIEPPAPPPGEAVTQESPGTAHRRRVLLAGVGGAAALVLVLVLAVVFWSLLSDGSPPPDTSRTEVAPTPSTTVTSVSATEAWTPASASCESGLVLDISATGEVDYSGAATSGPNGVPGMFPATNVLPDAAHAALIGRVGDGEPFYVGTGRTLICDDENTLAFGLNDTGLADNAGSFSVSVTTRPDVDPLAVEETSVTVPANVAWTETGRSCTPGSALRVTATGQTSFEGGGEDDRAGADGNAKPGTLVPAAPHRGLLGRIGEGEPFFVGSSAVIECPSDGMLFLGPNDKGVNDNSGAYVATITHALPPL